MNFNHSEPKIKTETLGNTLIARWMKSRFWPPLASSLLLLLGTTVSAAEITVVPALAYQDKQLTFEQEYSGDAVNEAEFTVHLPMIYAGLTVVVDRFYVAFKIEQNLSSTSTTTDETDRSEFEESNLIALDGSNVEVDRQDMTITLGYKVIDNLNLFVGYLDGKTTLRPDPFCANPFASLPCSRTNRAFQQFFLGDNDFVTEQAVYEQTYSEEGVYAGAAYGIPIADIGTITASLAYAIMDGKYKDNANDPDQDLVNFVPFSYEGDTTGVSLGLTWTQGLGETSAYFVDMRVQSYSMDGKDTTGNLATVKLETKEKMFGITAGLQLYF
ncbi:hypothetical protein TDB9533_03227 [Thalassocella blandensis]|nr:hypothetical protein TDB9533_03227 [Thalassocella blandensis]